MKRVTMTLVGDFPDPGDEETWKADLEGMRSDCIDVLTGAGGRGVMFVGTIEEEA